MAAMTFREAFAIAKAEFPARLALVRRLTYMELAQLPAAATTEAYYGEHLARWTVYRDLMEDGHRLMIVLQLSMKSGRLLGLFPMGNVDAEGFVIDPLGSVTLLPPEDLYDFT